jgi:tetratricopeptide (TPR) repeat protein
MNKVAVLLLMVMTALAAVAQTTTLPADSILSPAERSMAQAKRLIEKNPRNFEAYNALALAFSRRARETSNVKFYAQAEETLKTSFEISPHNFDGEKIHVWLLLGRHEFAAAREEARKLNKKMPDDVMVYGFLTDANIEVGNYKEAEDSAQLMLDIRPGNLPGLARAAYLRELFGDLEGSIELMNMAYQSTPPSEAEDRAWTLSQIAHLQLMSGKIADADNTLQQALTIFPGYHYALGNLAKVRIEQKRYEDAVKILQQRYDSAQHAENLYDLAEALELAGHRGQAQQAFGEFETKSTDFLLR